MEGRKYKEQVCYPMIFKGTKVGNYRLDFLIEEKVVLEIKKGNAFSKKYINQILSYLKISGLKLGILANFGSTGVKFKRIINFDS